MAGPIEVIVFWKGGVRAIGITPSDFFFRHMLRAVSVNFAGGVRFMVPYSGTIYDKLMEVSTIIMD
jgi:hypothetical protein